MFETSDWINLILAIILFPLGLIPILNSFGIISFTLPLILDSRLLLYAAALIGIYMLYIAYTEYDSIWRYPTLGVGVIIIGLGLADVLGYLNLINMVGAATLTMILNYVYVIIGGLLFFSLFTDRY